jgi:hypothetical protein
MFTIGTDSEHGLFLDRQLVSAIGRLPGDKKNPVPLPFGGMIQVDNVLAEWNSDPAHTSQEFNKNINNVFLGIKSQFPQYELGFDSTYNFSRKELNKPEAWIIGCEPDFNVYMLEETMNLGESKNPPGKFSKKNGMRSAAAHVHISPLDSMEHIINIVQRLDVYLGLPSLFLDPDRKRRQLYGKAGAFRPKEYGTVKGVEYRTLGAFWTRHEYLIDWVYDQARIAWEQRDISFAYPKDIQEVINTYDVKSAAELMEEYDARLP